MTETELIKAAWHDLYGGSPKHDSPSEEFVDGWKACLRIHYPILDTQTGRILDRSELRPTQLYERGPDGDQYRYQPIIKEPRA